MVQNKWIWILTMLSMQMRPSYLILVTCFLIACPAPTDIPQVMGSDLSDVLVDMSADVQGDVLDQEPDIEPDVEEMDSSPDLSDAEPDMPLSMPIGILSGECGVIDQMDLASEEPQVIRGAIDFGEEGFEDVLKDRLTPGGLRILETPNAGGSSVLSEVFSFEVLARCERAELLKTENEIQYNVMGDLTDTLVEIDGRKVGVSVTRAYVFMGEYTRTQALEILNKKLAGINESSLNVADEDRWDKQILHVIAYESSYADTVADVWQTEVASELRANTILLITVTDGNDEFIY